MLAKVWKQQLSSGARVTAYECSSDPTYSRLNHSRSQHFVSQKARNENILFLFDCGTGRAVIEEDLAEHLDLPRDTIKICTVSLSMLAAHIRFIAPFHCMCAFLFIPPSSSDIFVSFLLLLYFFSNIEVKRISSSSSYFLSALMHLFVCFIFWSVCRDVLVCLSLILYLVLSFMCTLAFTPQLFALWLHLVVCHTYMSNCHSAQRHFFYNHLSSTITTWEPLPSLYVMKWRTVEISTALLASTTAEMAFKLILTLNKITWRSRGSSQVRGHTIVAFLQSTAERCTSWPSAASLPKCNEHFAASA